MKKVPLIKNIVLLLFAFSLINVKTSAQLTVTPNVYITSSGSNTQIVLQSLSLVNNGNLNFSSGNVQITGNGVYAISGNGPLSFYNLEMNKNANHIILSRSIAVKNQLKFTAGILNLNGYDIDLLSTGTLINEKGESRITGSNGGKVKTIINLNAPNGANPGNLGAVFTSAENFGTVSIQRGHQSQLNDQVTGSSILRYYEITPTSSAALKATLRFNYFDAELNGITKSNLVLFKGSPNGSWEERGFTTRDAAANYVEKTNIPYFSRWTLSNTGNVLASGCPDGAEPQTYYRDADGDGYGDANNTVKACTQPTGYVTNKTDCNDDPNAGGAGIYPGATEVCNGIDDDCDGMIDEGVQTTYYADVDNDGYGNTNASIKSCTQPAGYIIISGDCNDNDPSIYPGAAEICDNFIDDNCNGQINEGCAVTLPLLTINDITVNESQGSAQLIVTLSEPTAATVKVKYKTINGTAVHPKDYIRTSGELVFAPGSTTQTIGITLVADNKSEPDEFFDVELNSAQGAAISDNMGRVTITENSIVIGAGINIGVNQELDKSGNYFNVIVNSNPTNAQFRLQIESSNQDKILIQISDGLGRTVERLEGNPFQTIYLGSNYRSGIYFAHIIQGGNRKTVKMIKL